MYCGLDFGTSNSVITVLPDVTGGLIGPTSIREPSLIYFPPHPESAAARYVGEEARDRYVGSGMQGRFFQSIKTSMPDSRLKTTSVNGKPMSPTDLVAVILRHLRERAEAVAGHEIDGCMLGRPARFSLEDAEDSLAEERLAQAARQAGFRRVHFELEPIAGAHAYAQTLDSAATIFVADHGGGTSDFTLMRIGPDGGRRQVLATHGVRAGGDDFDSSIMWNRLVEQFGYGTTFYSLQKELPVPVHIYHMITRWDRLHFLNTNEYKEQLREVLRGAQNPLAIRRLQMLIQDNLGFPLFQAIEAAKIELSEAERSRIVYSHGKLAIDEPISRMQFEEYGEQIINRIREAAAETLRRASIAPEQVDAVFLTGGSSRVPAIARCLQSIFRGRSLAADAARFESVAMGLALSARRADLRSW